MNHSLAQKIYEEIKNEPYNVSTEFCVEAPNCYFKGIRLIKALAELGYAVRGRVADIDWKNTPVPSEIVSLIPKDAQERHFFVEVMMDDEWRTLDPSIDPETEKLGFRAVSFDGDPRTCFDLDKRYMHVEQIDFLSTFSQEDVGENYFNMMLPFLISVNEWFDSQRKVIKS